jgi:hypothetical protein
VTGLKSYPTALGLLDLLGDALDEVQIFYLHEFVVGIGLIVNQSNGQRIHVARSGVRSTLESLRLFLAIQVKRAVMTRALKTTFRSIVTFDEVD